MIFRGRSERFLFSDRSTPYPNPPAQGGRVVASFRVSRLLVALGALVFPLRQARADEPKPGPPRVKVVRPIRRQIGDYEDFMGRAEAVASVEIRPRVGGMIDKVSFAPGTIVARGDVLFEIDPRPYQVALERVDAQVEIAIARMKRVMAEFERAKALQARAAIPRNELDKAEADMAEAQAELKVVQSTRDLARLNLSFTRVVSPIDGRIDRPLLSAGNLVVADTTPLATIVSVDPVTIAFEVDELTVLRLRRAAQEARAKGLTPTELPVRVGLADEGDLPRQGRVDSSANRLDPATSTLRLRALVPDPDKIILPGMTARVRVAVGPPRDALLAPEKAVFFNGSYAFVYVVTDRNVIELRQVDRGQPHDGFREVKSGLAAEEWIVDSITQAVSPGMTIEPERPAPSAP